MSTAASTMQNFLRDFTFIIFYRKYLIVITTIAISSIAIAMAVLLPPVYKSSAKFFVSITEQLDPLQKERFYSIKEQMVRMIQNQKELIYSIRVLRNTAETVFPNATGKELEKHIEDIQDHTSVAPPKGESFESSNVFYLSYEGKDPSLVHNITQTLTEKYIEVYAGISKSKAEYSYSFFKKQVEQLDRDLKSSAQRLRNYEIRHSTSLLDILNLESGQTNTEVGPRSLLTNAMGRRQEVRQQIASLNATIRALETEAETNFMPVVPPDMEGTGKTMSAYRIKVAQLQLQINEMSTRYTDVYQPLNDLKKELDLTIKLQRDEFESQIKAKKIQVQSLNTELKEIDASIIDLEKSIAMTAQERSTYESLKQEYNLAEDAYTKAVEQLEQARMAASLNQDKQNLTLVEEPQLPERPIKPNRILLCILGVLGGAMTGVALALVTDYFDHTIKTPEDIERYLGVPCLGSISKVS